MSPSDPTIRSLTKDDEPELRAFLERHAALALPLLLTVERGGIVCTGQSGQAHFLAVMERNLVRAVLALGTDGLVMVLCPEPEDMPRLVDMWKDWFEGAAHGLLGPREQVEGLVDLLGGDNLSFRLNNTELVNEVRLEELPEPPPHPQLDGRLAREADLELLVSWRLAWLADVMHMPLTETLAHHITRDLRKAVAEQRVALLEENGTPLAMGQCMTSTRTISQLGGFYVPENLRGRGYGLAMIDRLCRLERQRGILRSLILTIRRSIGLTQSLNELGFNSAGYMGLILFDPPIDASRNIAEAETTPLVQE